MVERWPAGGVLLVDTYELLAPLDDWLRDTLLPQLPARSLVVIAGRNEPATAWRTDVDWAALTRIHPLGNLDPDESRTYLTRCGVPAGAPRRSAGVHARTSAGAVAHRRCPDAWRPARVVAPRQRARDRAPAARDVRAGRAEPRASAGAARLRDGVGDDRAAARRGARSRPTRTTCSSGSDSCRSSSTGPTGCSRTISRGTWSTWISAGGIPTPRIASPSALIGYLYGRLERTQGLERQRVWFDLIYVQRYNPSLRPYFEWAGFRHRLRRAGERSDHAAILEMVERHEGPASAAIARYWLTRQPEAFLAPSAAWAAI